MLESTHRTLTTVLDSLVFFQHLCLLAGSLKDSDQISEEVLVPIHWAASQADHCKFHFCVYLTYLLKSTRSCKALISEVVSDCMGNEGIWDLQLGLRNSGSYKTAAFILLKELHLSVSKVPVQSMSNTVKWWPGKCRKQLILYQPKHPCRAGRLSKIFPFWLSLREWGGETVMARKVWTSKSQGPKLRTKQTFEVALSQKSVPLQWWSVVKYILLSFPWLTGWRLPDPSSSKKRWKFMVFPVIFVLLALCE